MSANTPIGNNPFINPNPFRDSNGAQEEDNDIDAESADGRAEPLYDMPDEDNVYEEPQTNENSDDDSLSIDSDKDDHNPFAAAAEAFNQRQKMRATNPSEAKTAVFDTMIEQSKKFVNGSWLHHTSTQDEMTRLLSEIAKIEQEINNAYSRADTIAKGMRENIGITPELTKAHLRTISKLLKKPVEERSRDVMISLIRPKLDSLHKEVVKNYDDFLKVLETYVEPGTGRLINFDAGTKEKFKTEFAKNSKKYIDTFTRSLDIDPSTDLTPLQQQLRQQLETQTSSVRFLVNERTRIIEEIKDMKKTRDELRVQLEQLQQRSINGPLPDQWTACMNGDLPSIQQQFAKERWPWAKNWFLNERSENGWSLLHLACYHGHLHIVQWLIEQKTDLCTSLEVQPINLCISGFSKDTTTIIAMIEALVKAGVPINATSVGGRTALHEAVLQNQIMVVQYLITQEKIELSKRDNAHCTPFYYAIADGSFEIANTLLARLTHPCSKNPLDPDHIDNLRKLKPRSCEKEIRDILLRIPRS